MPHSVVLKLMLWPFIKAKIDSSLISSYCNLREILGTKSELAR